MDPSIVGAEAALLATRMAQIDTCERQDSETCANRVKIIRLLEERLGLSSQPASTFTAFNIAPGTVGVWSMWLRTCMLA